MWQRVPGCSRRALTSPLSVGRGPTVACVACGRVSCVVVSQSRPGGRLSSSRLCVDAKVSPVSRWGNGPGEDDEREKGLNWNGRANGWARENGECEPISFRMRGRIGVVYRRIRPAALQFPETQGSGGIWSKRNDTTVVEDGWVIGRAGDNTLGEKRYESDGSLDRRLACGAVAADSVCRGQSRAAQQLKGLLCPIGFGNKV